MAADPVLPAALRREPTRDEAAVIVRETRARTGAIKSGLAERREIVGALAIAAGVCAYYAVFSRHDRLVSALMSGFFAMLVLIGVYQRRGLGRARQAARKQESDAIRWVEQYDFDIAAVTIAADRHDGFEWWLIELENRDRLVLNQDQCSLELDASKIRSRLRIVVASEGEIVTCAFEGFPVAITDRTLESPNPGYWPADDRLTNVGPFWFAPEDLVLSSDPASA
jgi:hypothetical protein